MSLGSPHTRAPMNVVALIVVLATMSCGDNGRGQDSAPAPENPAGAGTIRTRISPPAGYTRVPYLEGSFGAWLRDLPLQQGRSAVRLHNGQLKGNQTVHHVVVDMDIGTRDLQQCADAAIRLRAEYLFSTACADEIRFVFTSGDTAFWKDWRAGMRPSVQAYRVSWRRMAEADSSYENFRYYLDVVFTYAGSLSLERELVKVEDPSKPEIGDVFIQGGSPGHAVVVVDVAESPAGDYAFLLAQSYMPAQDIHVLKSYEDVNPWYLARSSGTLRTPEWTFSYSELRRFALTSCEQREPTLNRGANPPTSEGNN